MTPISEFFGFCSLPKCRFRLRIYESLSVEMSILLHTNASCYLKSPKKWFFTPYVFKAQESESKWLPLNSESAITSESRWSPKCRSQIEWSWSQESIFHVDFKSQLEVGIIFLTDSPVLPVPLSLLKKKHPRANFFLFHEWTIRISPLFLKNSAQKITLCYVCCFFHSWNKCYFKFENTWYNLF